MSYVSDDDIGDNDDDDFVYDDNVCSPRIGNNCSKFIFFIKMFTN